MKKQNSQEMRIAFLNIMNDFDRVCRENNITYYLHYGTLLGAVRHQGFIPWDDDVDVSMPRPDFERFILMQDKLAEHYEVQYANTVAGYPYAYAKIRDKRTVKVSTDPRFKIVPEQGLDIDIFPLDGFDDDEQVAAADVKKQSEWFLNVYMKLHTNRMYRKIRKMRHAAARVLSWFISPARAAKRVTKMALKHPFEQSNYVGISTALYYGTMQRVPKHCYGVPVRLKFENGEYNAPSDYEKVLENIYGPDYMTPPPPEKRTTTHTSYVCWKDK